LGQWILIDGITYQDDELIEYGLCVIWEMVENQASYLDEAEVFSLLFHVRYANTHPVRDTNIFFSYLVF
jgi:hypothetical protein